MSGSQALSVNTPALAENNARLPGPRVAVEVDTPVRSPVHDLQGQLEQLQDFSPDGGHCSFDFGPRAPGWIRLTLPIGLSLGLWSVIFWIVALLR